VQIRSYEKRAGVSNTSIIGVTANSNRDGSPDPFEVKECIEGRMDALTTKPMNKQKLMYHLKAFAYTSQNILPKLAQPKHSPLYDKEFLVVDDDTSANLIITRMLTSVGGKVDTARDGQEAIEMVESRLSRGGMYSVILMDCVMPLMGGQEATERIRMLETHVSGPRTQIIAITSGFDEGLEWKMSSAGCNQLLYKPLRHDAFLDTITRCCQDTTDGLNADEIQVHLESPAKQPEEATEVKEEEEEGSSEHTAISAPVREPPSQGESPPIDIEQALALNRGDFGFVQQLIEIFLPDCLTKLEGLLSAVESEDAEAMKYIAHSVKGSSALIGATQLHQHCIDLEEKVAEAGVPACAILVNSMCRCLGQMVSCAEEMGISVDIKIPPNFTGSTPPETCALTGNEEGTCRQPGMEQEETLPVLPQKAVNSPVDSSGAHKQLQSEPPDSGIDAKLLSWSDVGAAQLQCVVPDVFVWLRTDRAFHVLSIDDQPEFQTALCTFLEACGLSTTKMSDGAAALQSLKQPNDTAKPDLVLLNLPIDSAVQLCSDIREMYQSWKLPVMTLERIGGSETAVVEATLFVGANDYISLPADPEMILGRIEAHLCRKLLADLQQMVPDIPLSNAISKMKIAGNQIQEGRGSSSLLAARSESEWARSEIRKLNFQAQELNTVSQASISSVHGHQASPTASTVSRKSVAQSHSCSIAHSVRCCRQPQWVPKDQELMDFLSELSLSHYAFPLESNSINVDMMAHMSDAELKQAGVTELGSRILIRMALQPPHRRE